MHCVLCQGDIFAFNIKCLVWNDIWLFLFLFRWIVIVPESSNLRLFDQWFPWQPLWSWEVGFNASYDEESYGRISGCVPLRKSKIRKNPKMDFSFLYWTDQSKICRIMVRQRNRIILDCKTVVFGRFRKAGSAVSVILECEAHEPHSPQSVWVVFRRFRPSHSQKIRLFCSLE